MIVKFTGPLKPIKHKDSQALVVNFEYLISRPHLGKDPSTPLLKASGPRPLIYKWGNWGLLKFSDLPKFTSSHFPARIHGCHTSWIACASWFQTEHGSMPCCCQCRGGWGILKQCSEQILEGKWTDAEERAPNTEMVKSPEKQPRGSLTAREKRSIGN